MNNLRVTERLMEAAVQLFAEKGFAGTATRDIARLAEVNETSLFRIFGSKEDLFWAALSSRLQQVRLRKELQQALAEDAHPRVVLPLFIEFVVHTAAYQPELIRLLGVALLELRPQAEIVQRQALAPIFRALVEISKQRCRQRHHSTARSGNYRRGFGRDHYRAAGSREHFDRIFGAPRQYRRGGAGLQRVLAQDAAAGGCHRVRAGAPAGVYRRDGLEPANPALLSLRLS